MGHEASTQPIVDKEIADSAFVGIRRPTHSEAWDTIENEETSIARAALQRAHEMREASIKPTPEDALLLGVSLTLLAFRRQATANRLQVDDRELLELLSSGVKPKTLDPPRFEQPTA